MNGKERVIVEITQQCDREAIESRRPTPQPDLLVKDHRTIRLKQKGIHPESRHTTNGCESKELSPIDWKERQTLWSNYKVVRLSSARFSILRAFDLRLYAFQAPDQKLKVATKSMRRFAVVPGEN